VTTVPTVAQRPAPASRQRERADGRGPTFR